jgi:hypothetical protein
VIIEKQVEHCRGQNLDPIYLSSLCNRTALGWLDKKVKHKDMFYLFNGPEGVLYDINADPEESHYSMHISGRFDSKEPKMNYTDGDIEIDYFVMELGFRFNIHNFDGTVEVVDVGSNASFLNITVYGMHDSVDDPLSINTYTLYKPAVISEFFDFVKSMDYCHPWELNEFLSGLDSELPLRGVEAGKKKASKKKLDKAVT